MKPASLLVDSHGRVMRDLRVSVTDRCNFRCMYCLPETEAAENFYRERWATVVNPTRITRQWQPKQNILSFEEIEKLVRLAAGLGIQKIRITGGEPLLRQDVERLIERLALTDGITDLAMTTNGFLFRQKARALRSAGLKRISFSCDSLDPENFRRITGRDGLKELLASVRLAQELGFAPVKVNAVVIRGINDHEIESLAEFAVRESLVMRFIEFMPLDSGRAWQRDMVVAGAEILRRLQRAFELKPVIGTNKSETAKRWNIGNSGAEIGIIAPVTEPFCGHCNRIRLTADGKLRTCLFSVVEHDFRSRLRDGASENELCDYLREAVGQKEARHHIGEPDFKFASRSMSCIGG
ncbi:MAG TPA: GTP 3',8-cyclase MoaA [Methylomirabilota bacterium]|nr:GTP 3',8-cyclase MoaA [Methylomirabilota bacterium]